MIRITIYILSIVLANVVTAKFEPLNLGLFIIPYVTLFIGVTLVMRDMVQNWYGRKETYVLSVLALRSCALISYSLVGELQVVLGSTLRIGISETTDREIYTRHKLPFVRRVMTSAIVSGLLDPSVFVLLGI